MIFMARPDAWPICVGFAMRAEMESVGVSVAAPAGAPVKVNAAHAEATTAPRINVVLNTFCMWWDPLLIVAKGLRTTPPGVPTPEQTFACPTKRVTYLGRFWAQHARNGH